MLADITSVPVPLFVRSAPESPAITEAAVKVLPDATVNVASDVPSVIPRAVSRVNDSDTERVPPLIEIAAAVKLAGTAPRLRSDEIEIVPLRIVVAPS